MISELRSALASANDRIKIFEDSKVVVQPVELAAHLPVENIPCSKCLDKETNTSPEDNSTLVPDPLTAFPPIELSNARQAWSSLFHDRREIQHTIAILDQREKDLEQKIVSKKQKNNRVESISLSTLRYIFCVSFLTVYFKHCYLMCRLEKLRSKLEREISSQKPSLEQIGKKKEELSKSLELSADKEITLSKEFELAMQNLGNEEMKQIVSDAMRMKQLEVLHSTFYVCSFQNFNHDVFFFVFFLLYLRLPFKRRKIKTRT